MLGWPKRKRLRLGHVHVAAEHRWFRWHLTLAEPRRGAVALPLPGQPLADHLQEVRDRGGGWGEGCLIRAETRDNTGLSSPVSG